MRNVGILYCVLAAAAFGGLSTLATLAAHEGVPLLTLLTIRFGIAAIALWPLAARASAPAPSDILRAVLLGAGLFGLQAALFLGAVQRIDAPLAGLLLATYPALVALGAIALRRDRFRLRTLVALALALSGMMVALGAGGVARLDLVGLALALGAAAGYAAYVLAADGIMRRLEPLQLAALVCAGAAIALGGAGAATGQLTANISPRGALLVAALAVGSTALPHGAFLFGVRLLGATRASIVMTLEPVATAGIAALALGTVVTPPQIVGGALVVAGAVVAQRRSRAERTRAR
jgi:drug/metabolite transporter (DMT)-like permease